MPEFVSKNFTKEELACKCCGEYGIQPKLLKMLQELRDYYAKPIIITSGFRCKKHNDEVRGEKQSQHLLGLAVDIHCVDSGERDRLLECSFAAGFTVRGIDDAFIHLDCRPGSRHTFLY